MAPDERLSLDDDYDEDLDAFPDNETLSGYEDDETVEDAARDAWESSRGCKLGR